MFKYGRPLKHLFVGRKMNKDVPLLNINDFPERWKHLDDSLPLSYTFEGPQREKNWPDDVSQSGYLAQF